MRRVFLIGLGIGAISMWMGDLYPKSMISEIFEWLLIADQNTPLSPNPSLFLYLFSMQTTLILLYGVIAKKLKVNNHLDMVIIGMSTGILLKWFAGFGEKELQTGIALFLLGYPAQILYTQRKEGRFAAIRVVILTIHLLGIRWLIGNVYQSSNQWITIAGVAIAMLGAFTEINGIRPIGALTLQTLLKRTMEILKRLFGNKPSARMMAMPPTAMNTAPPPPTADTTPE